MIPVTRLDGSVMVVNDEQIAFIETRPDTVISMMNGEKLLVREAPDTLVERARDFKRSLLSRPFHVERRLAAGATVSPRHGRLEPVAPLETDGDDA
jgi:flagellar protein FlbD